MVILESSAAGASPAAAQSKAPAVSAAPVAPVATASSSPAPTKSAPQASAPRAESVPTTGAISHASPSVRKYARELGVDVSKVIGTSAKGRISQEDVQAYVKNIMTGQAASPAGAPVAASGGLNLLPWPKIDFSKFGETRNQAPVTYSEIICCQFVSQLGHDSSCDLSRGC